MINFKSINAAIKNNRVIYSIILNKKIQVRLGDNMNISACLPKQFKKVEQYSLTGDLVAEYNSVKEASTITTFNESNIRCVCNGQNKTAYGFKWKYKLREK